MFFSSLSRLIISVFVSGRWVWWAWEMDASGAVSVAFVYC